MNKEQILDHISRGRTDLVFELLALPDWQKILNDGQVRPLQWFVYYNDTTALKAVLAAGGDLTSIDLNQALGNASFFGHWKVVDFLIANGANVNFALPDTGETPIHSALSKAGKPYYLYVVRLLVENGANVNAATIPGKETSAFMRDIRTKGETPLHRAAAYSDETIIKYLLDHGSDPTARDANGDSPLTWASAHLRPGKILHLLSFPPFTIGENSRRSITADHGNSWGDGMDRKFIGDYLPESLKTDDGGSLWG